MNINFEYGEERTSGKPSSSTIKVLRDGYTDDIQFFYILKISF